MGAPATGSASSARFRSVADRVRRLAFPGRRVFRAGRRGVRRLTRVAVRVVDRRRTRTGDSVSAASGTHSVRREVADAAPVDPVLAACASARLVIVESARDAVAAVRAGVPRARVWLVAFPQERATAGEPVSWAAELRDAAESFGGLITDSQDAAGILERLVAGVRTIVMPPVVPDRGCPSCGTMRGDSAPAADQTDGDTDNGSGDEADPTDGPGNLRLWRRMVDRPQLHPGSYAAARQRGEQVRTEPPMTLTSWGATSLASAAPAQPEPVWDAAAQLAGGRRLLERLPPIVATPEWGPRRVRVFGTDLRFMRDLAGRLGQRDDLDVAVDEWPSAGTKNEGITERLARGAQTLVAEWCRPNAVWLSEVKRPDQHLIVRLHRFEIDAPYPHQLDIDAVDAVVYVGPHMGARITRELGWPAHKLVYVPLYLDLPHFDRPKYPDARFTLGMVGIVPSLKRFDLALDLLAALRREDPRYTLVVRSQMGWTHKPSWQEPAERGYLHWCMERIEKDPLLRGAVTFDSYGADMAAWFRKVGHVLSLSDIESFHAGLAEGMAAGAVPVLRGWPGAAALYGRTWITDFLEGAVADILAASDMTVWTGRSEQAKRDASERFDPAEVLAAWVDLAHGQVAEARSRFHAGSAMSTDS